MVEVIVPSVMFLTVGAILILMFWFRFRSRREVQATLRAAVERGQELNAELIEKLANVVPPRLRDLRLGAVWMALALGLTLCGIAVPADEPEVIRGCLAGAAFPFCIGAAYLLLWRFADYDR